MDTYHLICVLCQSDTYYNCIKYHKAVCNGPDSSTSVDESQSAFVNRVLAQRKDRLVYLHFFNQGSYFLLSHNAKTLIYRSL